jgi:GNAT superfamily N-acetyltransferase
VAVDEAPYAAAGLYDPAAVDAADRLALLEHLDGRGFTLDEMLAADREGRLSILALERLLADSVQGLTVDEVARRTGITTELVERAQRAVGLPPTDGPIYGERSTAAFAAAAAFFGTDPALQFSRVLGSSLARIVDAAVSLFVTEIAVDAPSSLEVSTRSEDAVDCGAVDGWSLRRGGLCGPGGVNAVGAAAVRRRAGARGRRVRDCRI